MARKKKHAEHANHERWLVSYADFITLLFAFFTTLYAISVVDAQKLSKVANSMQSAFHTMDFPSGSRSPGLDAPGLKSGEKIVIVPSIGTPKPKSEPGRKGAQKTAARAGLMLIKNHLESEALARILGDKIKLLLDGRGLIIRMAEIGFYDSGASTLKPEALGLVDTIAAALAPLGNHLRIEGHTDNVPIKTLRYRSNWELSTARASGLVTYLIKEHDFDPNRLSASGFGEFRPMVPNDTPEHRALNRHVDIIVMSEEAMREEPATGIR
jgi:chemotaxis protein MotB